MSGPVVERGRKVRRTLRFRSRACGPCHPPGECEEVPLIARCAWPLSPLASLALFAAGHRAAEFGESRDDGCRFLISCATPLRAAPWRRVLGLLQLRLGPALLRDVAGEREDLGNPLAFADGCVQHRAGAFRTVGASEGHLEAPQLAREGRGQVFPSDAARRRVEPFESAAAAAGNELTPSGVGVEHAAVAIEHENSVGTDAIPGQTAFGRGGAASELSGSAHALPLRPLLQPVVRRRRMR